MVEKKKKKLRWMPVVLAAATVLAACENQVREPVVAERTNPASELTAQGGNGRDAVPGMVPKVVPEGEKEGTEGQNPVEREKLSTALEVPERYEARVEGSRMRLTADAAVWVPERTQMSKCRMTQTVYSDADYRAFQRLLSEETGAKWGEDRRESSVLCVSQDGNYQISFVDGATEGTTPILWMQHQWISDGSGSGFDSRDLSGLTLTEEEKSRIQEKIRKRAEDCLKKFQEGSFTLKNCEWRALQEKSANGGTAKPTGTYGIRLHYVREYQGIPIAGTVTALMGEPAPSSQYVNFLFDSDGTLLRMQAIDCVEEEEEIDDSPFLLLFDTAVQIFEQYCKTYFQDEEHWAAAQGLLYGENGFTKSTSGPENEPGVEIRVNSVMLEYRLQPDERLQPEARKKTENFTAGTLIPVWNFYGTVAGSRESLLVSINAEDGTIYGD